MRRLSLLWLLLAGLARLGALGAAAKTADQELYLPVIIKQAQITPPAFKCSDIVVLVSPSQAVYRAGDTLAVNVANLSPQQGQLELKWARSPADTRQATSWTTLPTAWNAGTGRYEASWILTSTLGGPFPTDLSNNQEFILAATLWNQSRTSILCDGNPDFNVPFVARQAPLDFEPCENCRKIVVTRQALPGLTLPLASFWNVKPGYSLTYSGDRPGGVEDDHGQVISGTFTSRLDYEAPVSLCGDTPLIPQRFTKDNRWGYWLPAAARRADRNGSVWTEGSANLRFFISDPSYTYTWQSPFIGAYAHKIYDITSGQYTLGELGSVYNRTIIHTSRNHENYYYPPYLLSLDSLPSTGTEPFARLDTIYHYPGTDAPASICNWQTQTLNHNWYTRAALLSDADIKQEFQVIQGYFDTPKDIAVLTFFEGGDYSSGKLALREDWFLMKDVGLVGIDQGGWNKDDPAAFNAYFSAPVMKDGTPARPSMHMRAQRGYLGQPLEITPVSPATTFPLHVAPGSCYTLLLRSAAPNPMPYDGMLDQDLSDPPALWKNATTNQPHWAAQGLVTECLPAGFPSGEYKAHLRAHIQTVTNPNETPLDFAQLPWSSNELWIIVP